jgi:glycosyltransferase involved in cell wall biosynthesis
MKILIAATHLNKGGIAFYSVNLARQLKLFGAVPVVLSSGGDLTEALDRERIMHVEMPIRTKAEFGFKMWRALPEVARMATSGGFDIIHSQTRVTQVMSEFVSRMSGIPYVTTCHGFFKHRRLSRRLMPCWGEKVIAISKSVRDHLLRDMRLPEQKVELVYNGIDLDQFEFPPEDARSEVLREAGIREDTLVIGAVGRLSGVKGFRYLVEAFDIAASEIKNISLLVVGQGPDEADLLKQASQSASSDRMFFIPGSRPLADYLAAIDIFCMPSLHEGFGLAVVEAMASGKACIVSGVGGLTEIVTSGEDGMVVAPASGEELGKMIMKLAGDPALMFRLSDAARKRALDFSLEKSVKATMNVYESVLSGGCVRQNRGNDGR